MVFVNLWGRAWLLNNRKPFQHLNIGTCVAGLDPPWFPKMTKKGLFWEYIIFQYSFWDLETSRIPTLYAQGTILDNCPTFITLCNQSFICICLRSGVRKSCYTDIEKYTPLPLGSSDRNLGCLDRHWFPFITNRFPISTSALNYRISSLLIFLLRLKNARLAIMPRFLVIWGVSWWPSVSLERPGWF